MRILGICGTSGSGKTTLIEALIPRFKVAKQQVSVIKHAHHAFEPDTPGKDSWRHRQAGAHEVMVISAQRMALFRDFDPGSVPLDIADWIHQLQEVPGGAHWTLVEGFKQSRLRKLEVWRAQNGKPPIYPGDPSVVAIATDRVHDPLPVPTSVPVLDLGDPDAVFAFLLSHSDQFELKH